LQIQKLAEGFEKVELFHTMRGLNSSPYAMANKAHNLQLGLVWKNGG
jgi:hypothetical protein